MPLLDSPLDTFLSPRFPSLDKLSMRARWGWSTSWGVFPAMAVAELALGDSHAGVALLFCWVGTAWISVTRPWDWMHTSSQRKKLRLPYVAIQYVGCTLVLLTGITHG